MFNPHSIFGRIRSACVAGALTLFSNGVRAEGAFDPPIWQGAYIGLQGGVSSTSVDLQGVGALDYRTGHFGGFAGFMVPLGPLAAAIEADINLETLDQDYQLLVSGPALPATLIEANTAVTSTGSVRARVGVPISHAFLYATAGYAWANVETRFSIGAGADYSSSSLLTGFVYGGGIEAKVMQNIAIRAELLRFEYDEESFNSGGFTSNVKGIEADATVARGAVVFHFN